MGEVNDKRRVATDSVALIAASLINGIAAYAYIAVGTRTYGAGGFAAVSILWTIWALTVAVVTFPLQHWTIRATVWGDESVVRTELAKVGLLVFGFAGLVFAASFLGRSTLFGSQGLAMPIFAGVIVIEAAMLGLARGLLSARGQFKRAAIVVGGENVLRIIAAGIVLLAGGSATAFGASLVFGVFILALFPSSLRPAGTAVPSNRSVVGELGGIAGGTLVAQVILTGQPLAVSLLGAGSATVTAMFATAAVFRAPYLIALGLALRSMRSLTEFAKHEPRRLNQLTIVVAVGGSMGSAVVAIVGAWLGPPIIAMVFGSDTTLERGVTGVIVFGSAMALVSLGLTLILIAQASTRHISISWIAAAAIGLVPILVLSDPVTSVVVGFASAETSAVAVLAWFALRDLVPITPKTPSNGIGTV